MATPDEPLQTRIVDDKSPICIPFILSCLEDYKKQHAGKDNPRPFIIGLNGIQGVGKTTLVRALAETLEEREGLPTLVVSIDDFYLTHADQLALAEEHPDNALVQHRGQPGTHDLPLLGKFLDAITSNEPTPIPQYDKSAFSGLGDRLPPSTWPRTSADNPPRVVILEGWCVGFRALAPEELVRRWGQPARTLHRHKLEHLAYINMRLTGYEATLLRGWKRGGGPLDPELDAFVHVDAADDDFVYAWRAEQEAQLRRERGSGMSEDQVRRFVDAYYPAYELYNDGVRRGVFQGVEGRKGRQLRIVVGRDRAVVESMVI